MLGEIFSQIQNVGEDLLESSVCEAVQGMQPLLVNISSLPFPVCEASHTSEISAVRAAKIDLHVNENVASFLRV